MKEVKYMKKFKKTMKKIEDFMNKGVFPGFSVAYIEEGKVTKFFGGTVTNHEHSKLVEDGLFYDLASVTKAFVTSTLLIQMVEKREINLDECIVKWFPNADKRVTLRHLITHTSGLWGYIENRNELAPEALIEALSTLSVTETFHHTVKYTDTGFVLAGIILEKEFGKPIADLFEERIARPLKLTASYGPLPSERCVPTAFEERRGRLLQGEVHDPKASILQRRCGSAGLFATLDDCITLVQLYLQDGKLGEFEYCSAGMMQSLLKDWTPTRQAGRSLGWDMDQVGEQIWLRHTGFTGTTVLMNLTTKQAMIMLTNRIYQYEDTPSYNRLREELILLYEQEANRKMTS